MRSDLAIPSPSSPVAAMRWRFGDLSCAANRAEIAVETPVNIRFGSVPYAVMMATPADLEDFATGFALGEGLIASADEIREVAIEMEGDQIGLDVTLAPGPMRRHLARRRRMSGRTSCGVCGIEDGADLPLAAPRDRSGLRRPGPAAIARALGTVRERQPLNALTRSVHAAFWCDLDGGIALSREDVGRHNALDKLAGAVLRDGYEVGEGFVLVTSRASFEMVEKTAALGAATLVCISAPTSLAIDRARAAGLTLVATARDEGCVVYAGTIGG